MSAPTPTEPQQPAPANPLARLIARMSLTQLTLAVLTVIFLVQWFAAHSEIAAMREELARRLAELDGSTKAYQTLVMQNQEMVRELGGKLGLLESRFAETQTQRAALETLYQEMSSARDQTALADVEQLLLIAAQQLQLSANVKAALIALQQADSRLQLLDRPSLNELRKLLARDIDRLRAQPAVDINGLSLRLDGLVGAVDGLPLAQDIRTPPSALPPATPAAREGWQAFWHELWQEVKSLVQIRNTAKEELPLLSPTQTYFLRENLKLRLLSARLALLSRNETGFRHDLGSAQEWLQRYFDLSGQEGAAALQTLQTLAAAPVAIDLPDISPTLEAVRHYRLSREKGAR